MYEILITLDYELPVGGRGDVRRNMIAPTAHLMDVCENHAAKLTIMVEIAGIWAFEKAENLSFKESIGYEPATEIRRQLVEAIQRGHDVQLHLHPQWINASWNGTRWDLDYAHYCLTDFSHAEMVNILRRGKKELESLLGPHRTDYHCVGFRAGHWNTQPYQTTFASTS